MKKPIISKTAIVAILAGFGVSILTASLIWGTSKQIKFIPDDPLLVSVPVESWTENTNRTVFFEEKIIKETENNEFISIQYTANGQPKDKTATEPENEYPQITEKNEEAIMINFIDPESSYKEPPPKNPGTDFNEMPAHPPTATQSQADPNSDKPIPGSVNEKGEVYDRAFGWVKPGGVMEIEIDSAGDPNKMVGKW